MSFDSGIKGYVHATAVISVSFPIDWQDKSHIACKYCPFLSSNERMCQLNKMPVAFPMNKVGDFCPLEEVKEDV